MLRWVHTVVPFLALLLAGCGWNGAPKEPIEAQYAACKKTCKGTCTIDGKCLPNEAPK